MIGLFLFFLISFFSSSSTEAIRSCSGKCFAAEDLQLPHAKVYKCQTLMKICTNGRVQKNKDGLEIRPLEDEIIKGAASCALAP